MTKIVSAEGSSKVSQQLTSAFCIACNSNSEPISATEADKQLALIPNWHIKTRDNIMILEREFTFKNYKLAWTFANKVSTLAESEGHHPAILLEWGKVTVTWWPHTISGLHQNDFICAAKTEQLL
ncbi:4a-hydroxytetrahydrobiopterin dehydratase [Colwellia sp. E2M01]|uniref:4a-hydroxytetrahydrobiopterin dehydratase n=1 Tax=Colwellia sp. E2M01 TaxID=2841561 RepID=UPI001C07F2F3|nr:4a-hydroxytetrahydrobiopterin dehydratase [Colwellia sp. E2M01]MBU2870769.1 4a-hydroxytetrahydrobiopterin dehydratase [Colwellia sp. E2M01]